MDSLDSKDIDRMVTVGELSAILAHEIKNPMNSIIINMEVLRTSLNEVLQSSNSPALDKSQKYLNVIEGEIKRLDKVIKGFLDFANPGQATRVKFDLNSIVQSIRDLMDLELKSKNINLHLDLNPDLPKIVGSSDQIKQAMINLVINAMQALKSNGNIALVTREDGDFIEVIVEDDGPGMAHENIRESFKPYFTTKEKGSGLGLSIVNRVVKDHGGNIFVKSEIGKGSRFTIQLPKVQITHE